MSRVRELCKMWETNAQENKPHSNKTFPTQKYTPKKESQEPQVSPHLKTPPQSTEEPPAILSFKDAKRIMEERLAKMQSNQQFAAQPKIENKVRPPVQHEPVNIKKPEETYTETVEQCSIQSVKETKRLMEERLAAEKSKESPNQKSIGEVKKQPTNTPAVVLSPVKEHTGYQTGHPMGHTTKEKQQVHPAKQQVHPVKQQVHPVKQEVHGGHVGYQTGNQIKQTIRSVEVKEQVKQRENVTVEKPAGFKAIKEEMERKSKQGSIGLLGKPINNYVQVSHGAPQNSHEVKLPAVPEEKEESKVDIRSIKQRLQGAFTRGPITRPVKEEKNVQEIVQKNVKQGTEVTKVKIQEEAGMEVTRAKGSRNLGKFDDSD